METHAAEEAVALEKQSSLVGSAGNGPWSNNSLHATFVGTAAGTVLASFLGGDPSSSLPITMWFQYTFDGEGHVDRAFGEATIGGKPSGLIKASGTYRLDPATGMGMETITLPDGRTPNRRFSLSNDNTRLHWVSVDPGFQFKGTMQKQ